MTPLLFRFLFFLIFVVNFKLEFLECEFRYLCDFLLSVKSINQRTLLCNLEELDEKVLLVDAAVADAKLHEKVLQLNLGRVVKTCHPHCVDPEGQSLVQVLRLRQAVVEEADAHL